MIDEAILRPGRLEVHIEISLPDEHGRLQIFRIHTAKMRENDFIAKDVSLEEMAKVTKNYTGAEIEAVVKGATSFALYRQIDLKKVGKQQTTLQRLAECLFCVGIFFLFFLMFFSCSFSLQCNIDLISLLSVVTREDFERALSENQPAFGMTSDEFENCASNGIVFSFFGFIFLF